MKKLLYLLIIPSCLFIAPACNKKLEVLPQNSVTPDQIKTSSDVEALLFGGYEQLQNYAAFGEQYMLVSDLFASSEQITWVGTYYQYKDVLNKAIVSNNSIASTIWSNGYNAINIVNTVLDKLSVVDSADKASVEAEARFIRATVYFELVGFYGKPYSDGASQTNLGVPIVLLPTYAYDPAKNKPVRAKVSEVYAQIVSDLQTAIAKFSSVDYVSPSDNNFRADIYSARAILSRVYLNMQDYANAAAQADSVIQSGVFTLTSSYDKAFNNNSSSSEDIFAIQESSQSNAGNGNQGINTFYAPQPLGRGDAQIDDAYFNHFESFDFRANYVTNGESIAGSVGNYPNKWAQFYKAIPVVRLAEMYLTRGEANLFLGGAPIGGVDPVDDINTVRERSNASDLSTVTQADFVDERFRELGFEGDRFWTLKRLQIDVDGLGYDNGKLILPVPQSEIDVNKNLVQNAGY